MKIGIIKRDGTVQPFLPEKIATAVMKACRANNLSESESREISEKVTRAVTAKVLKEKIGVEEIQDLVEKELMGLNPSVAKSYILYRDERTRQRASRSKEKEIQDGIVGIAENDINLSNANMSTHTPAGQMMTFGSESSKCYALRYLLGKKYAEGHIHGDIHIHDLDYYPTKTTTCVQYNLKDIFSRGFVTKNGGTRPPQSIQTYATQAAIIFQCNQNEQHGGQAIPALDFFLAPGVLKSYIRTLEWEFLFLSHINGREVSKESLRDILNNTVNSIEMSLDVKKNLFSQLHSVVSGIDSGNFQVVLSTAIDSVRKETHQAMEGLIHNLNTMHSRGGNQVVFSSVNYGTDTSPEGRMVMIELLRATKEGLGKTGDVPIFPIQILKVKDGVTWSRKDYDLAMKDFKGAISGKYTFEAPNFDITLLSCQTTARCLFPNFLFLDTPFNHSDEWKADDPDRWMHEVATMGCRTRVFENVNGKKTSVGRGNLSFTTINLPRLAIEAVLKFKDTDMSEAERIKNVEDYFLLSVREMARFTAQQLYERYCFQCTAFARQYPFMMMNNIWAGGSSLSPGEKVGELLKQGTLGIGFIGGHNAMMAIYNEGHGKSRRAWNMLYSAISAIKDVADEYREKYHLNYSVLATPAEGLSGRFTKIDREKYGKIKGVTDKDYYVNSFHVDVAENIGIVEKIKKEAPFHKLTLGGHITYIELDGEAKKNIAALLKIVKVMHDEGIGYGSINHPVDTCTECGYAGIIYDKCPICKSGKIKRLRRITGYLVGDLDRWNKAKRSEEHDRVKHGMDL